jgi:hypothetical protein
MNIVWIIVLIITVLLGGSIATGGQKRDDSQTQGIFRLNDGSSFRIDTPSSAPGGENASRFVGLARSTLRLEQGVTPRGCEVRENGRVLVFHGKSSPRSNLKTPSILKGVQIVGRDDKTLEYLAEFSGKFSPDQADNAEEIALELARIELGLSMGNSEKGFVVKRVLSAENLLRFEISPFVVRVLGQ